MTMIYGAHTSPLPAVYELVGAPTGNCRRAAIALEAAGIPYTVRLLDLPAGAQYEAHHLALNPSGKVPVLTGGGAAPSFVLTQSNAIMLFAAERAPKALLPGDAAARARVHEAYFQVLTDVIGPSHAAFRLGAADGRTTLDALVFDGIARIERMLERDDYLGGPRFSLADIAGYTIVHALSSRLDLAAAPRIAAWLARVAALPAVERGMAAFG